MKTEKVSMSKNSRKRQREIAEKVKTLDEELLSFYDFCEKMGFTTDEMDTICSPLSEVVTKNGLTPLSKILIGIFCIFCLGYGITQVPWITTHSTAIGRIILIKLLSIWDWRHLFHESCLVTNPMYGDYGFTQEDCMACEAIESIDVVTRTNYNAISENYLSRDAPVIVSDATEFWPVMNKPFSFENITQVYEQDGNLMDIVPCVLTTNIRQGGPDLGSFLKIIGNSSLKKWFVHWQNCDIQAVKALRQFYEKPYFLPNTISPAHFNWVLMSSEYSSRNYKKLELDFGLIIFIQIRGNSLIRLLPYKPCNNSCPELSTTLHQGEILILKNYLWSLEYLPSYEQENVAIITETAWDISAI